MLWSPPLVCPQDSSVPRPLEAAALLDDLNPPRDHQAEWAKVGKSLESYVPLSAWQSWPRYAEASVAHGLLGPYQNRLSALRRAQLQASAERLRPVLEKNDLAAYRRQLPRQGEKRGPLALAFTLQPLSEVGREDLLPEAGWAEILLEQSQYQALRAGVRLARGQQPEMPHRWEGRTCVCWTPGLDGNDLVYRFR